MVIQKKINLLNGHPECCMSSECGIRGRSEQVHKITLTSYKYGPLTNPSRLHARQERVRPPHGPFRERPLCRLKSPQLRPGLRATFPVHLLHGGDEGLEGTRHRRAWFSGRRQYGRGIRMHIGVLEMLK